MRWLLTFFLVIGFITFGIFNYFKGLPFKIYSQWVNGTGFSRFYNIKNFKKEFLAPSPQESIPEYHEDYAQLWKEFPLGHLRVPLPVRHPLIQIVPILEASDKKNISKMGIIFTSPEGREMSRIYALPLNTVPDYSFDQDLFKLPYFRNQILKIHVEKIWNDLFLHEIQLKKKSISEMAYDLYILHLRSKYLPSAMISYRLISDRRVLIELDSANKDYKVELILTNQNGVLYSFVIKTEIDNQESQKLRSKFINSIKFNPIDIKISDILYKEFKHMNFSRQVDQEGMLYLFSAWSQDTSNFKMFREIIFYLERGNKNSNQLKILYQFALDYYGRTFTTGKKFDQIDDLDLVLQKRVEWEKNQKSREKIPEKIIEKELSPKERMDSYLQKANDKKVNDLKDATIY